MYTKSLAPVNDWRAQAAAATGGDSFLCPRCGQPRFVPAGSNADGVLFCSRSRPTPGLSGASQGRDVCNFAARARKWRLLPKATSSGDGPRGSTVLEMLCGV